MKFNPLFRFLCVVAVMVMVFSVALRFTPDRMGVVWSAEAGSDQALSNQDVTSLFLPVVIHRYPAKHLGLYIKLVDTKTWNGEMDQFIALTGATHGVHLTSAGFACPWVDTVSDIRQYLDYIHSRGATPLIAWMPTNCGNGGFGNINVLGLPNILNGSWDAYMTQWAAGIAALGYPVFVRWGHEMNIPSYSWGGQHAFGTNGKTDYNQVTEPCGLKGCYGDPNQYDGPERYIAAYRHVHDLVAPIAPNIVWVWNPNGLDWPRPSTDPWNGYNNYYPGDAYVDWIGVDGYNWGQQSGNGYSFVWATFDYMYRSVLDDLASRYPAKPQMIPELASVEDETDPNRKANWIRDAYQSAYYNYPLLKVVSWENEVFWDAAWSPTSCPCNVTGHWADFRVNSSPQALQAYKDAIQFWLSQAPLP